MNNLSYFRQNTQKQFLNMTIWPFSWGLLKKTHVPFPPKHFKKNTTHFNNFYNEYKVKLQRDCSHIT